MTPERASVHTPARAFLNELSALSSIAGESVSDRETRLSHDLGSLVDSGDALSSLPIGDLVNALCTLALHPDSDRSELGRHLIFTTIAESLADSFEPDKVLLYDQLFARVIDRCRYHHSGRAVGVLLSRFNVNNPDALLARKEELRNQPAFPVDQRPRIRRVFVPSRITLGADVAVTSIVLQKVERVFPRAECLVFGPSAPGQLLQGTSKTPRFVDCPYPRHGGIIARLGSWVQLVNAVQAEMNGCQPDECVFVDPDSRLTQLGLLPVVDAAVPCFFFESRGYRRPGADTLGELTARWLDEALGPHEGGTLYPQVVPSASDSIPAEAVARQMRASGGGHVTAVNLGVGGNARKRIPGRFELDLIRALLSEGGAVMLDRGIGEEVARVEAIVSALTAQGIGVIEMTPDTFRQPDRLPSHQLLICQGGLGPFTALVAASDLYVGYDSGFQHIAAALSVPVLDIFVNAPNELFGKRWRPYSRSPVDVVETATDAGGRDVLPRILAAYRKSRS